MKDRDYWLRSSIPILLKNNTRASLEEYYKELFGISPRSSVKKVDILYSIREYYLDEVRTSDLCKLLKG